MSMKKILCLLLCVLLLSPCVFAADEDDSLSQRLTEFRTAHGLDESNFAVCFYNSKTGALCSYNADTFFPVGSVWQFPLHMYYYEQEAAGAFEIPPEEQTEENQVYKIGVRTLEECRYQSIILGRDEIAEIMRDELGSVRQYKELINREYGHIEADNLPENYFTENVYSARFLLNCLRYLDARNADFNGLTANYRMIQTGTGLGGYSYSYEIVHVADTENGMICDIAGVSAPQPYLLVAFMDESFGEGLLSELNDLFCASVVETQNASGNAATQNNRNNRDELDLTVSVDRPIEGALPWVKYALIAAAALLAIGAIILLILHKRQLDKESI